MVTGAALRILVAGGGIGGLAAALATARSGHSVNLFERAPAFAEVGAGVQLGPNVTHILHTWGLADGLKSVAAFPDFLQVRSAQSGATLGRLSLGDTMVQRYGSPYVTIHRADLHGLLLDAALKHANVNLNLNAEVTSFSQSDEGVRLQFKNRAGDKPNADPDGDLLSDLLVGADGGWSPVRRQLLNDGTPAATGHLAYRAMVRQADLPPALRSQHVTAWLGPKLHVVQYPVRGGDWLNVVAIIHGEVDGPLDTWDHSANALHLRQVMTGMAAPLRDLINAIDAWRLWPLSIRPPMRSAREHALGRVALLGDAAHPMLPYLAQGAGMAIEDAAVLAASLGSSKRVDVVGQLQLYAQTRWQRNARVQARAIRNGQIFHATGLVAAGRDVSMKLLGEKLLDMPWLYGGSWPNS
jgi:salicylate hydroxylase